MKYTIVLSAILFSAATKATAQSGKTLTTENPVDVREISDSIAQKRKDMADKDRSLHDLKAKKAEDKKAIRDLKARTVGLPAKEQFHKDFPGDSVIRWETTADFKQALFISHDKETTAYYDDGDNLVGTTVDKTFEDLPVNARTYIKNTYPDYSVSSVVFFDDNERNSTNMKLYNKSFEDHDYFFVKLAGKGMMMMLKVTPGGDVVIY